eukprot:GHUV01046158.1.p1 GENE.GHUV01046158.1~~GHUV01046158.1.p1  ORF type:complete len:377 (+),score=28.70 GHUV01046158.1:346-1476(+)
MDEDAHIGLAAAWSALSWRLLIVLAATCCCLHSVHAAQHPRPDERLIGWLGETYVGGKHPDSTGSSSDDPSGLQVLSWEPRIMHYRRFLSEDECNCLMNTARPRLKRSDVADSLTGQQKLSDVRTSSGMFFERGEDAVVRRIEERVAMVTMLPVDKGEGMQILHYGTAQEYKPHHDYFSFEGRDKNGGNRMATVLMYLTDVEAGGETVFPHVAKAPEQTLENGWSNCSLKGLAVKPRKGDATIFWSIRPDGTFDYKSLHGSCPVIAGEKWSATKWIHVAHFATGHERPQEFKRVIYAPPPPPRPPWCQDNHKQCPVWAESGTAECWVLPRFHRWSEYVMILVPTKQVNRSLLHSPGVRMCCTTPAFMCTTMWCTAT